MARSALRSVTVTFTPEGLEYAVTYAHEGEPPNPGTKTRTTTAARMARRGLEVALEGLAAGAPAWGGFGTNTKVSRDVVMVERGKA